MGKFLIVNADDFGLNREISHGISRASKEGIVTSTSVVVNGKYFEKGISLLKDSGIDTGIHLTFVGSEKPLTGTIDGLVDKGGLFLKGYRQVIPRIMTNRFDRDALKKELFEQAGRLRDAGFIISHIDSHQHLHLLPAVGSIAIELARYFDIKWIRLPRPGLSTVSGMGMNVLSRMQRLRLTRNGLSFTDWFEGFEKTGKMNEQALFRVLRRLKEGSTELIVHPGYDASGEYDWGFSWNEELKALCSENIKRFTEDKEIILTRYTSLQC